MNQPALRQRLFTLDEANATLPLVRCIMRDVLRLSRRVRHSRIRLKFIGRGGDELAYMFANEIRAIERELKQDQRQLDEFVAELEQLGIEPEGLSFGLVDFPTVRDGQCVYFCWRYDESDIRYWHTRTGGFVNRQPIETAQHQPARELVGSS